jgi:hypothetical protein
MVGSLIHRLFYFRPRFPEEILRKKKKFIYKKLYVYDKVKHKVDIKSDIDINERLLKN